MYLYLYLIHVFDVFDQPSEFNNNNEIEYIYIFFTKKHIQFLFSSYMYVETPLSIDH